MLGALIATGYGGSTLLRHGHTTLPAYREHLNYRVRSFQAEQGKSVALPARGRSTVRRIDGAADIGIARKRTLPCNRADRGCVALMGQYHLAGNGADFAMVFKLEDICGTDVGSKANDGGASCWCSFPHVGGFFFPPPTAVRIGRRSVSSRFYLMLNKAASSFFGGGVIECSSRMKRKFQVRFLEGWPPAMGAGYSASG